MKNINLGFLVSGRGSNLGAVIDAIKSGRLNAKIVCVISDVESAFALQRARQAGIPAIYIAPGKFKTKMEPEIEEKIADCFRDHKVDLVCLAGYMRIVKETLLAAYPMRIINIHPALLPSFPGLHAQKQAVDFGVKIAGCTVHFVDEGTDTGPIILQASVPVYDGDTENILAERILKEEHRTYPEAIRLIAEGKIDRNGRRITIRDSARGVRQDS